jgi:class 3 adenylate cyclase/DNA-binding response OmpR family regulator
MMNEMGVEVHILIVDDSDLLRGLVVEALSSRPDFRLSQASDGAAGLELALTDPPDLILLDMEMPRLNGLQVLDGLRDHQADIPVILMTGHGSETIAVEVFRKGVRDYLIKPFTTDDLLASVDRALTETRLRREKETLTRNLALANEQLTRRVEELDTLYRVGKSVTMLLPMEQMLERILDAAFHISGAEEAVLMLIDETDGRLRTLLQRQRVPGKARQGGHRSAEDLAADALRKGDVTATGAMLSAPLKVGPQVIGVLGVSNPASGRPFSHHDRRLLLSLADYAAIALENARLLRAVEETKEGEKRLIRGMFERYVSPAVVERLLAQPDRVALGGVRQPIAVLFADIRGFSTYSSHTSPEQLVDVLNRHLSAAAEAVLAEEGTLDKFMGDAVMAFFNAPLPQPDFPLRAARAALRLQRCLAQVHQGLPPEHRLSFGAGIAVGEAVVGNIGTAQMMTFTAVGDTVNLARRLQEYAAPGQTLLSHWAYISLRAQAEVRPIGTLKIKGHEQPEPVYELLRLHGA